jgi:hypothetical protein
MCLKVTREEEEGVFGLMLRGETMKVLNQEGRGT